MKLLLLGTVETGGGGCVCPEHVMLKRIINHLILRSNDVVSMDMELVWSIWAAVHVNPWNSLLS